MKLRTFRSKDFGTTSDNNIIQFPVNGGKSAFARFFEDLSSQGAIASDARDEYLCRTFSRESESGKDYGVTFVIRDTNSGRFRTFHLPSSSGRELSDDDRCRLLEGRLKEGEEEVIAPVCMKHHNGKDDR